MIKQNSSLKNWSKGWSYLVEGLLSMVPTPSIFYTNSHLTTKPYNFDLRFHNNSTVLQHVLGFYVRSAAFV